MVRGAVCGVCCELGFAAVQRGFHRYIAFESLPSDEANSKAAEENVVGEALVALQHSELKEMGMNSMGHRLSLLKAVYEVKLAQNVLVESFHYVPVCESAGEIWFFSCANSQLAADVNSPDMHVSQHDLYRIIQHGKSQDQRIVDLEGAVRLTSEHMTRLVEEHKRFREDALPAIRMAKDKSQPLPTPEPLVHEATSHANLQVPHQLEHKASTGLSRKFSTKKLFLSSSNKPTSPTIHEGSAFLDSPSAGHSIPSLSPAGYSQQNSPTSPPYAQNNSPRTFPLSSRSTKYMPEEQWTYSNASMAQSEDRPTPSPGPVFTSLRRAATVASANAHSVSHEDPTAAVRNDFMKSFRVSMEEPCHKVLPAALKKYHINGDWRQYSLYIVHGDEERCLGLDERPLTLFKQLGVDGKKPMFMLRKHAAPQVGFTVPRAADSPYPPGSTITPAAANGSRVQSYAGAGGSGLNLPGGVL